MYPRFAKFKANHFIATLERQCAELREIEKEHPYMSKRAKAAYAKEAVDCISVAQNFLRRLTDDDPKLVAQAIKARASRYANPNAIIDLYVEKHGA